MFIYFVTICVALHGVGTNDFQFIHFLSIKQAQMHRISVFSAKFSFNSLLQDSNNAFFVFFLLILVVVSDITLRNTASFEWFP